MTLIGMTTWPPREGFTEEAEFLAVSDQVDRSFRLRYSFSPNFPPNFTNSPMAMDHGRRHRMWSFATVPSTETLRAMLATIPYDGLTTRLIPHQEPAPEITGPEFRDQLWRVLDVVRTIDRDDLLVGVNLQGWDFDNATDQRGQNYLTPGLDFLGVTLLGEDSTGCRAVEDQLGNAAFWADAYGTTLAISSLPLTPGIANPTTQAMTNYIAGFVTSRLVRGYPLDHLCSWAGTYNGKTWGPASSDAIAQVYRKLIDRVG